MSLAIHANTPNGRAVYNLQRQSQDAFNVQVDWDKSDVRNGGYGLEFKGDTLEVRDWSNNERAWDVQVAPQGHENEVYVMTPPNGFRGGGAEFPIDQIDFGAPIAKEQSRQVALQVASSLIQVPFLDRMLEQPVPTPKA